MRRALHVSAAATAGAAGVIAWQMYACKQNFCLPPDASGPISGVATAPRRLADGKKLNLVFIGDSLVTGVGCAADAGLGATLPRSTAKAIAEQVGRDVSWLALGECGADVAMLEEQTLPTLEEEVTRCSGKGEKVDAVVVMCGLNDIKVCCLHMQPWLHAGVFRRRLRHFAESLHETAGADCHVLLPGCPMEKGPRFADVWPMCLFINTVVRRWEAQKREVAADAGHARRLRYMPNPTGMNRELHFCCDGMHPNDLGCAAPCGSAAASDV